MSTDEDPGGVPMWSLFQLVSDYRRIIELAVVTALGLTALVLIGAAFLLPVERTGSLQFRLLFDGAADGRYPNGTSFSPAEIVATPVLSEVYKANDLESYSDYQYFKDSMSVLRTSLAQDLLAASYSARLADTRLTAVDRSRLEDEFRKKREALTDPFYTLTIRRRERLRSMPNSLMEKILNDTLAAWARQTDELKGVTRFDAPVFSASIIRPDLLERDFLIAADGLRVQARRAIDLADKLMALPGTSSIRTTKDRTSLSDVSFQIADILRNQIEPLLLVIHQRGLANDPASTTQYLRGRVVDLRLERDATRARIDNLQKALQGYVAAQTNRPRDTVTGAEAARPGAGLDTQTLIPQINDSFLDRLIAMSTQTQAKDVEYRQRLTERMIKEGQALFELDRSTGYYEALEKTARASFTSASEAEAAALRKQLRATYDELLTAVNRLLTLYEEVSAQRLNPAAMLYTVSEAFSVKTEHALTWSRALMLLALAVLAALVLTPIGCAIHRMNTRRKRLPAR